MEIQTKLEQLIRKYEEVKGFGKWKKYNEEETKKDFILPLFEALGWDTSNKEEVSAEETQSGGRVDYGFYLKDRVKFYLEAKPLGADLHKEDYANQAIRYSWNKGVTWSVLTDFESLKVFNAQDISKYLSDKLLFEIPYSQYLERFDQLQLLSKEAFTEDALDKYAEKVGKKLQKISVSTLLYKDLNECRDILTKDLAQWNSDKEISKDLLDEGVQKILDRLLFIRVAEDRGIEPQTLIPLIRQWEISKDKNKVPLYRSMVSKFRELDDIYNSNLFSKHPFEEWEDYSDATKKVVNILYGKRGYYEYDFKIIPADVLGAVYENYLGYRLSQSKKSITLDKDARKRKEQGIYYTPNFIVDYIVRNALGPILDNCKSVAELKKIKVLDPACGSGSFLIKALEVIAEKYKEFNYEVNEFTKIQIITENLYGVDLDEQAVEIARLNLLINALDERRKLPLLDKNIKNGNSLISGTDEELEKYFGKNFRDKKPFNWQEEFPEVFKEGGFDVIIGNPPWGADIDEDIKYFENNYPNSTKEHKDIYKIFIERAVGLLKTKGNLGFITPNTFLFQPRYKDIRSFLKQYKILHIINLGEKVFINVEAPCCIFIVQKDAPDGNKVQVLDLAQSKDNEFKRMAIIMQMPTKIDQKIYDNTVDNNFVLFYRGLKSDEKELGEILGFKDAGINYQRVEVGLKEKGNSDLGQRLLYEGDCENIKDRMFWKGGDIDSYFVENRTDRFVRMSALKNLKSNERVILNREYFSLAPKLLWRQTAAYLVTALDNRGIWFGRSIQAGMVKKEWREKISIYYLLALMNSKYLNWLYTQNVKELGRVFPQVKLNKVRALPIKIISMYQQGILIKLAKKMIKFNIDLRRYTENSNWWNSLKSEIEKTDKKIDEEVYKLYGLTKK